MSRKQADTIDTIEIVTNPEFARGLAEVRAGLPFNPDDETRGTTSAAGASGSSPRSACRCASAAG